VANTTISVGGVITPEFDVQSVQTTVAANDGETIVIGGLITKADTKQENKIPWFGDLPYVGAAFRYRTQQKGKVELLVMLTPRVVRSKADMDRIMYEESRRMDWIVGDVMKTHGTLGMEPIVPAPGGIDGRPPGATPPGAMDGRMPAAMFPGGSSYQPPAFSSPLMAPPPAGSMPPPAGSVLPAPTPLPPGPQGQAPATAPGLLKPLAQQMSTGPTIAPMPAKQEDAQWTAKFIGSDVPNRK
jgi:hypothetical protein